MAGRSEGLALEPIWTASDAGFGGGMEARGGLLPADLAARYAGELAIALRPERPTIIANFVSSLDGVVAMGATEPTAGGGEISGFSESDRFMMALLRGLADVVIVGAGTVRAGRTHEWTPRRVAPSLADAFAAWRSELWLTPQPTTIVVSASGHVDPRHAGLSAPDVPVIVVTTTAGAAHLGTVPRPPNMRVVIAGDGPNVAAGSVLQVVQDAGARLALCEGGPHLFGDMLRARLVDELFLTVAPQVIGRDSATQRLGLAEGVSLTEGRGRWADLTGVRRAGDDLFLRYRFRP
jgi:riboflavin biosynthesis pyrimidine reductase